MSTKRKKNEMQKRYSGKKAYQIKNVFTDKRGINTVEIIIILAVFIGLILLFKDYITEFIQKVLSTINRDTDSILGIIFPVVKGRM
jgi:uncharacterized membrane protein YdfJ with MMPL/SSD domain